MKNLDLSKYLGGIDIDCSLNKPKEIDAAVGELVSAIQAKIHVLMPLLDDSIIQTIDEIAQAEGVSEEIVAAEYIAQDYIFTKIGQDYMVQELAETQEIGLEDRAPFLALSKNCSLISSMPNSSHRPSERHFTYHRIPCRKQSGRSISNNFIANLQLPIKMGRKVITNGFCSSNVRRVMIIPFERRSELKMVTEKVTSYHTATTTSRFQNL